MAFDEANHRLFVGCRSGQIVIFDTETGKELQALPINTGIDDMVFDAATKRIYAPAPAGDGTIDVYGEIGPDRYRSLGQVPGGPGGRSGSLVPELDRYFLAVPQHENINAAILVYKIQ
jgi:DNA-binding beta-propeller fold protein YncE